MKLKLRESISGKALVESKLKPISNTDTQYKELPDGSEPLSYHPGGKAEVVLCGGDPNNDDIVVQLNIYGKYDTIIFYKSFDSNKKGEATKLAETLAEYCDKQFIDYEELANYYEMDVN